MQRNEQYTVSEKSALMQGRPISHVLSFVLLIVLALIAVVLGGGQATAQSAPETVKPLSPLHPVFAILDANGQNVPQSGAPVFTMRTCGNCRDTSFIASYNFHSDLGLSSMTSPGQIVDSRAWDTSNGAPVLSTC